ncbi:receptor-like protein 1 [Lolium rigidum]|uniref:receptor-like protein 1 n=1 Tax=Lolium rigidum TaxID=89674 RepID=UPI001F5CEE00|nr:receptor-like protein 1 [Lolium rigidum]
MGSLSPWGQFSFVPFLLLQFMLHVSYGCSVEEMAALLEIRSSLMRAHSLEVPDSWRKDDHDCCSWKHVKCNNRTQRVSHLDLSSVYATTEGDGHWFLNSTVFSVFHELQYLDLSYNSPCSLSLKGLVGLAKLRYLDLSGTMWGVGFPEFIGEIVSLEVLALNDNNITGGLPGTAVKNLRNLRQLNMTSNSCHGNLPESLFSLPHLKILDLSANIFGGHIPISSASRPISLEVLDLSSNHLNGTLPVAAFQNIRNLNLSGNQFRGSLPVSLFALPHLKFLDLSYNNFEGRFPISLSPEPVPLEVLNLHYNNMSGALPSEQAFENLKKLRGLYLSSNQFSGNIPAFLFYLPHIERLNLSTNIFSGPIPINPSLNLPLSLKSLRFSQNNLSGRLSFIWLGNLTKLEVIDLSGNANLVVDVNIPGWTPLFQLKQLLLSGCDLDKIIIAEPRFLHTQRRLEVVDLSNNNLSGSMPNWLFTKEATLQYLNLGNNSLTGLLDPIWHTQSFLHVINIHMNHIAGQLPANISSMFPCLSVLDFSNNNLLGHIPSSLCEISLMQHLDLRNMILEFRRVMSLAIPGDARRSPPAAAPPTYPPASVGAGLPSSGATSTPAPVVLRRGPLPQVCSLPPLLRRPRRPPLPSALPALLLSPGAALARASSLQPPCPSSRPSRPPGELFADLALATFYSPVCRSLSSGPCADPGARLWLACVRSQHPVDGATLASCLTFFFSHPGDPFSVSAAADGVFTTRVSSSGVATAMLSRRGVTVGPLRVDFFPSKNLAVESLQRAWARADSVRSLLVNPRVSRDVGCPSAGPRWTTPTRPVLSAPPGPAAPCVATPCAPPLTPHRLHPTRPLLIQRLAPGRTWLGPTCVLILRHPPSPSVTIVVSAPSPPGHRSGGCPLFGTRAAPSASAPVVPPPCVAGGRGHLLVTPHPFAFAAMPAAQPPANSTPGPSNTAPAPCNPVSPYSPVSPLDFAGASASRGSEGAAAIGAGGGGGDSSSD